MSTTNAHSATAGHNPIPGNVSSFDAQVANSPTGTEQRIATVAGGSSAGSYFPAAAGHNAGMRPQQASTSYTYVSGVKDYKAFITSSCTVH